MLWSGEVQAKPSVSQPSDPSEVEADRAAEQVMRMSDPIVADTRTPQIQRKCATCEEADRERYREREEEPVLQRQSARDRRWSVAESQIPSRYLENLDGSGSPLPESARNFFGPRFGRDFSDVRIHTGQVADRSAQAIDAKAFTYGRHIVFRAGQFSPDTGAGRKLLAHELAHTVQQGGGAARSIQRTLGDGHDLQAPRFAGDLQLEAAFDNELLIRRGSPHHAAVRLLQQSLIDQGYTLPGFGVDGIFGPETEAAIKEFQREAGAVLIDGIVGPETMALFDQHDTTLLTGVGPVQAIGPRPGPRPAPARGCDFPFTGVTFTLANAAGTGVTPAAIIRIVPVGGGVNVLQLQALPAGHANYNPDVTINAPNDPKAQQFQVGFASNLLTETLVYTYSNGVTLRSTLPTPTKDGRNLASGAYDPVYVEQPTPSILVNFAAAGDTVHLMWPDVPSDAAAVLTTDNPECAAAVGAGNITHALFHDTFRTWVVARHRASGCTRALHHIDWELNWEAAVFNLPIVGFTVGPISNVIQVTVANGDGSPAFIQGGQVPDDLLAGHRVCA